MLEKQSLADQRIIDYLNTYYGIEVVKLTFLPLGADMNASVYKAEAHNQLSYFVKLKLGHHHDIGIAVVELLHHAGIQQIILPVKTTHSHATQLIDDFTLIVYPFIEGQNGFSRTLIDEQWLMLGKTLRVLTAHVILNGLIMIRFLMWMAVKSCLNLSVMRVVIQYL